MFNMMKEEIHDGRQIICCDPPITPCNCGLTMFSISVSAAHLATLARKLLNCRQFSFMFLVGRSVLAAQSMETEMIYCRGTRSGLLTVCSDMGHIYLHRLSTFLSIF